MWRISQGSQRQKVSLEKACHGRPSQEHAGTSRRQGNDTAKAGGEKASPSITQTSIRDSGAKKEASDESPEVPICDSCCLLSAHAAHLLGHRLKVAPHAARVACNRHHHTSTHCGNHCKGHICFQLQICGQIPQQNNWPAWSPQPRKEMQRRHILTLTQTLHARLQNTQQSAAQPMQVYDWKVSEAGHVCNCQLATETVPRAARRQPSAHLHMRHASLQSRRPMSQRRRLPALKCWESRAVAPFAAGSSPNSCRCGTSAPRPVGSSSQACPPAPTRLDNVNYYWIFRVCILHVRVPHAPHMPCRLLVHRVMRAWKLLAECTGNLHSTGRMRQSTLL